MTNCTACGLPTNIPAHLPPPDQNGVCAACQQMTQPNFIERIATNQMPACFVPTREAYARMASHILLLRAALSVTATQLEIVGWDGNLGEVKLRQGAKITRAARTLLPKAHH